MDELGKGRRSSRTLPLGMSEGRVPQPNAG